MKNYLVVFALFISFTAQAQTPQATNKPDRVNWFQNLGFGMFIRWNVDVHWGQLSVIH